MPKIDAKKRTTQSPSAKKQTGAPGLVQRLANILRHLAFSILATPVNLLVVVMRLAWSGRRVRLASLALLTAGGLWVVFTLPSLQAYADTARGHFLEMTARAGFKVADITVEGRMRTSRDDLRAAVAVDPHSPIFALDLQALHGRVADLPWVRQAIIIRRLPNIVHIRLDEYEPFALHRDREGLSLVDRTGAHITRNHLRKFSHLPVFSGIGVLPHAASLMDMLRGFPVVRNRLVAAHWTGERRWTLRLDHGGEVHLPEADARGALNRLMKLERERRILAIENQAIDLRLPDRVLLRPYSRQSKLPAAPGQPTKSQEAQS
ncbi:MAG: cell division protein FtsQ/DivIB [Parvibaculales bacterium]